MNDLIGMMYKRRYRTATQFTLDFRKVEKLRKTYLSISVQTTTTNNTVNTDDNEFTTRYGLIGSAFTVVACYIIMLLYHIGVVK